jgi:recombinational DNA repair protein RecR
VDHEYVKTSSSPGVVTDVSDLDSKSPSAGQLSEFRCSSVEMTVVSRKAGALKFSSSQLTGTDKKARKRCKACVVLSDHRACEECRSQHAPSIIG